MKTAVIAADNMASAFVGQLTRARHRAPAMACDAAAVAQGAVANAGAQHTGDR